MSNYPPPPPADQPHYNAQYPTTAGAQQLLDSVQQDQFQSQLQQLNHQPIYPKLETSALDPSQYNQLDQRLAEQHQNQHHQQQQQQQQQLGLPSPLPPQSQQQTLAQGSPETAPKGNRLRKACDSCSIRKVKCDETGPPCRACAALDIPCTFERPSRRRGPPNRHAEAIKRRRLESPHNISGPSSPSSPTHAAQALAALSTHPTSQPPLCAESICPMETLDLLVNDFFTYIHPLCPFPHEPSFREALKRREDYNNRPFLALLASMIAALVASFPRKPRLHIKQQRKENMFPNHMSLVLRCQRVAAAARGPGYLESESLSVHDAATSYFLALTGVYTFRWRQGRLYFGECLTIIRALGLHRAKEQNQSQLGTFPAMLGSHEPAQDFANDGPIDYITQEVGRRLFWTMFVSVKTMQQLGTNFGELVIPPETPSGPYPPLPLEIDDFCIHATHFEQQPPNLIPMITGFNANVRVFNSYNALAKMEMAWGIDTVVDWERQKKVLHESLRRCKAPLDNLPNELIVWPTLGPFGQQAQQNGSGFYPNVLGTQYLGTRDPALMNPLDAESSPEHRRQLQYEIQKANIYASSLCTRSYIVEKYWNLYEAHNKTISQNAASNVSSPGLTAAGLDGLMPAALTSNYDMTEREMFEERESIVKDLLVVLGSINQVNMEPNADSFTMKVRSIASTLLDVPNKRKGQIALQSEQYLTAFLDILMKLERVSPTDDDCNQPEDEEAELRHWADLREYQMKFALTQQGGIMGLS
ncbi:hypothetical protein LTR66_007841 [Elasticomyces elasticus]|nr:hypothetical protein LTR66_007841 [Elasticomyces elasticus]